MFVCGFFQCDIKTDYISINRKLEICMLVSLNGWMENLPAAGKPGTRHVWQKHCKTESRTNPISILSIQIFALLFQFFSDNFVIFHTIFSPNYFNERTTKTIMKTKSVSIFFFSNLPEINKRRRKEN